VIQFVNVGRLAVQFHKTFWIHEVTNSVGKKVRCFLAAIIIVPAKMPETITALT
jgi:hypothetical protein